MTTMGSDAISWYPAAWRRRLLPGHLTGKHTPPLDSSTNPLTHCVADLEISHHHFWGLVNLMNRDLFRYGNGVNCPRSSIILERKSVWLFIQQSRVKMQSDSWLTICWFQAKINPQERMCSKAPNCLWRNWKSIFSQQLVLAIYLANQVIVLRCCAPVSFQRILREEEWQVNSQTIVSSVILNNFVDFAYAV